MLWLVVIVKWLAVVYVLLLDKYAAVNEGFDLVALLKLTLPNRLLSRQLLPCLSEKIPRLSILSYVLTCLAHNDVAIRTGTVGGVRNPVGQVGGSTKLSHYRGFYYAPSFPTYSKIT